MVDSPTSIHQLFIILIIRRQMQIFCEICLLGKREMNFRISNRSSEIASELRNVIRNFPAHLSISKYGSELEREKFAETDCNCTAKRCD
jgi:hypothetical protein